MSEKDTNEYKRFVKSLYGFMVSKKLEVNVASNIFLVIMYSFTNYSQFIEKLHSYHFEIVDTINEETVHYDLIFEEIDDKLMIDIRLLP